MREFATVAFIDFSKGDTEVCAVRDVVIQVSDCFTSLGIRQV